MSDEKAEPLRRLDQHVGGGRRWATLPLTCKEKVAQQLSTRCG